MVVLIDGVEYVPVVTISEDVPELDKALAVVMKESDAGDNITVREYLHRLLLTLWDEKEGFSGKRPFGNSSWEYKIYKALAKAGFARFGGFDTDDDYLGPADEQGCYSFVCDMITHVFFPEGAEQRQ